MSFFYIFIFYIYYRAFLLLGTDNSYGCFPAVIMWLTFLCGCAISYSMSLLCVSIDYFFIWCLYCFSRCIFFFRFFYCLNIFVKYGSSYQNYVGKSHVFCDLGVFYFAILLYFNLLGFIVTTIVNRKFSSFKISLIISHRPWL